MKLTTAEWVEHWERQERYAIQRARDRGVRHPAQAPEVLHARSFLRHHRAVDALKKAREPAV